MVEKESNEIYSFSIGCIFLSSFLAMFLGLGSYIMFNLSKNDTYIAVLVGSVLLFGIFYIFNYIFTHNEEENLIALNKKIFNKKFAFILNIILFIAFFVISCIIIFNISNFLNIEYLADSTVNFFKVLIFIPIIYICSKSLPVIIKANQIFAIISVIFVAIDLIGLYPKFDFINLEPILNTSITKLMHSILMYVLFGIVAFCMILVTSRSRVKDKDNISSKLFKMIVFSNIIQFIIIIATILVLGEDFIGIFRFPEYIALKQFSLFNILERVENILALHFYFNSFSLLTFLYYYMIKILPNIKIKKYYPFLISIAIYIVTSIVFKEGISFYEIVNKYIIYVIFAGILVPILLIFLKTKKIDKKLKIND